MCLGNSIRSSFWLPMVWPKWRLEDEFSTMFRVQDATLQTHLDIFGLEILLNPLEIHPPKWIPSAISRSHHRCRWSPPPYVIVLGRHRFRQATQCDDLQRDESVSCLIEWSVVCMCLFTLGIMLTYAHMYVRMYVRTYVWMDVMYVCMSVCLSVCLSVRMYVCMYACMHACMHRCIDVSMYLCMYLCMYLSIYLSIYLSFFISIYLSIYVSMYLCIYVSMYLCIYVSMYLRI